MQIDEILREIRARLEAAYGPRLKDVVLYGSQARGEADRDSDVDVMVLLEGPVKVGEELSRIIHAIYPLQLTCDRLIDAYPVDRSAFEQQGFAFYRRIKHEGVRL